MTIPLPAHRLLFVALLAGFFWLFITPRPLPDLLDRSLLTELKLLLAKLFHLGTFVGFAIYGTYRMAPANWKWLWLGLFGYAILTELGQYFGNEWYETNRTGSVRDVLIDAIGLTLGARWRLRQR